MDTKKQRLTQVRSVTVRQQASRCWRTWSRTQGKDLRSRMHQVTQLTVTTANRTSLIQQIHHLVHSNKIPANIISGCYYGVIEDIQNMPASHTAWSVWIQKSHTRISNVCSRCWSGQTLERVRQFPPRMHWVASAWTRWLSRNGIFPRCDPEGIGKSPMKNSGSYVPCPERMPSGRSLWGNPWAILPPEGLQTPAS